MAWTPPKRNLLEKYSLPENVVFCKKCTISNQRPRISFDSNGVCSACNFAAFKRTDIDWKTRALELEKLCDAHRSKDGRYDVVVPCSGGKDGSFVAHILKEKYGMNPLTVTWAPHIPTDIGRQNLKSFIDSGFDNILGTPNGKVHRLMTRLAFFEMGDPFQPFIYGQTNFPLKMAVQHGISLIMYGENGEVEYGGDNKNAFRPTREIADHDKHYFSSLPPEFWKSAGLSDNDLHAYLAPPYRDIVANKTEIHFMSYYHFWDPQENFYYCTENTGFAANPGRSEGTYSKYASLDCKIDGFHFYLAYIKFGIGRCTSDTAHEIRDQKINREEGIGLVRKFDGEFPAKYYDLFKEYIGTTDADFEACIDSWRSPHIWGKRENRWYLKFPIWDEQKSE